MPKRPIHRLTTALLAVLSLLCAQLALASYACPAESDLAQSAAMADMVAMGQPCDAKDAAQPALCHEHGASTAQSFETVTLPVPSLPLIVQVLALPSVPDPSAVVVRAATLLPHARPPPDPIFLSTLRLRV